MRALAAAILLATSITAQAELHEKTIKIVCGSAEDFSLTVKKYKETAVLYAASKQDLQQITYGIYTNFVTGSSSWVAHVGETDEYCMIGTGDQIYIPDSSPLKDALPVGTRIIYK
jgi:hypothetical protein